MWRADGTASVVIGDAAFVTMLDGMVRRVHEGIVDGYLALECRE